MDVVNGILLMMGDIVSNTMVNVCYFLQRINETGASSVH